MQLEVISEIRKVPQRRKSILGRIVLVLVGVQIAFFASFTCLRLPTATGSNLSLFGRQGIERFVASLPERAQIEVRDRAPLLFDNPGEVRYSNYTPLAPFAVLLGYVLGPSLAVWSVSLFLLLGLLGPLVGLFPLASGGGFNYYLEPSFGYLVGMIAGALVCGVVTRGRRTSISQLTGVGVGITALHLTGITYLFGTYLYFYVFEGSKTYLEWQPWIFQYLRNLSWYALPYDFAFAIAAVALAFPCRWLVHVLTAPDIGPTSRNVRKSRRRAIRELLDVKG